MTSYYILDMEVKKNFQKLYEEVKLIRQLLENLTEDNKTTQKLLEILAKENFLKEIEIIASTNERKNIWNLLDGKLSTSELADQVKITQRAVNDFIKDLRENRLVDMLKRGYYRRKFDYFIPE